MINGNGLEENSLEVLLAENDSDCADLTMTAAQTAKVDFNINWVVDGVEAMDYLRKRAKYTNAVRPDLILLDLEMPRKNGREVLSEIRADGDFKIIPVVILSTTEDYQELKATYGLSNDCCHTKPALFTDYIAVMRAIKNSFFGNRLLQNGI